LSEVLFVWRLVTFGIDGAHPPPGVKGAPTVAFRPSGGYTYIY